MASNSEISIDKIIDFMDIQDYMESAKEEGAEKTYALLKKKYIKLKAILQALGINLSEIDFIKE